jgi:tetratricopeptide (TPR) repeat protein
MTSKEISCDKHSAHTEACLVAVKTLIERNDLEGAHTELARLAKQADAVKYIDQFVELSFAVRKPDIIEAILVNVASHAEKVSVLFRLVDLYRRLGERSNAFRKAMELTRFCAESPGDLRKVATCLGEMGEMTYALDIRERLLRSAPGDYLLALDVIDAKAQITLGKIRTKWRPHSDLKAIQGELDKVMNAPDLPLAAWTRAAHLYAFLGDWVAALGAIRRAVEKPDAGFGTRHRLVSLLTRNGLFREAKQELASLFAQCRTDPKQLRMLGDLAIKLPDWPLARQMAETQYQCEPKDGESILYLARQLRVVGEPSRAQQLLSSLIHAEGHSVLLSDQQWVRLAEELYELGDITQAKEAVAKARATGTGSTVARQLAVLDKLGRAAQPSPGRGQTPERVPVSIASRLAKIFRR